MSDGETQPIEGRTSGQLEKETSKSPDSKQQEIVPLSEQIQDTITPSQEEVERLRKKYLFTKGQEKLFDLRRLDDAKRRLREEVNKIRIENAKAGRSESLRVEQEDIHEMLKPTPVSENVQYPKSSVPLAQPEAAATETLVKGPLSADQVVDLMHGQSPESVIPPSQTIQQIPPPPPMKQKSSNPALRKKELIPA